jgi:hypothetical protein
LVGSHGLPMQIVYFLGCVVANVGPCHSPDPAQCQPLR